VIVLLDRLCGAAAAAAAFCVVISAAFSPVNAQEESRLFDIPAQRLSTALLEFSRQSDLLVVVDPALVNGKRAPAVQGRYGPAQALDLLLVRSGLVAHRREGGFILRPRDADQSASRSSTGSISHQEGGLASPSVGGAAAAGATDARSGTAERAAPGMQETIVVTGTHIRGVDNPTTPVIVLDRADIEASGFSTTNRLIESLPQNFALTSQSGVLVPGVTDSRAQGSAINLRGLGEGTTLVLLNGRRMALGFIGTAVDISALPLSAIERVEILTDGASAIYGSDAVGGVVNFILRKDFDGAETGLRTGHASGVDETRVSQVLGRAWDTGNALVSLEYYKRDLLSATQRDFVPAASLIGSLLPEDENYSLMFSGRQVARTLVFFADALYVNRDSYNEGGRRTLAERTFIKNPQFTATAGVQLQAGGDWLLEASGSYARNNQDSTVFTDIFGPGQSSFSERVFRIESAQIKADGSLFVLPAGRVRAALGADWRQEAFRFSSVTSTGVVGRPGSFEQEVRSVFGEIFAPLVGPAARVPAIERLELSVAGRYDDYSTFGSSIDPQLGILWQPLGGLRLRASHGTSYVAPRLVDYNVAGNNQALALISVDPGVPEGRSHQLVVLGNVEDMAPQRSKNTSAGFDFAPQRWPQFRLGANYFRIHYRDRIANPPAQTVILGNPAAYGSLFFRNPSVDLVNQYIAIARLGWLGLRVIPPTRVFDPATVAVIIDSRRRNLGTTEARGVDLSASLDFTAGGDAFHAGLNGTYMFDLVQRVTSTSEPFDTVDTMFNPPQLRMRAGLGWRPQEWAADAFVNYTGPYTDNRRTTPAEVGSYTTVDAQVSYDFSKRLRPALSGTTVALIVQNLFDRDPPPTAIVQVERDMGFDPTNANPMGRLVALEFSKKW
jgi:iron complex outermembrane receptor protein